MNPPEAPVLKVLQVGEKWMNVSIMPSEGDNPGSHFYVETKKHSKSGWKKSELIYPQAIQNIQLKNLEPGTKYQVSVEGARYDSSKLMQTRPERLNRHGSTDSRVNQNTGLLQLKDVRSIFEPHLWPWPNGWPK